MNKDKWIDVKTEPQVEDNKTFSDLLLVYDKNNGYNLAIYDNVRSKYWHYWNNDIELFPTHWTTIPEPPHTN